MQVLSPDFTNNNPLPALFTCDGKNINPRLIISDVPADAASLVLIVDDPDAPGAAWLHWVVWNIPVGKEIMQGSLPKGSVEGINSWGNTGYGGPCPPRGTHRYFFKVYALDGLMRLSSDAKLSVIEKTMKEHVLASAQIVGTYSRE